MCNIAHVKQTQEITTNKNHKDVINNKIINKLIPIMISD